MSRLYGTVRGAAKTTATRRGHKHLVTNAAGWGGTIRVQVDALPDGTDVFTVYLAPWKGSGGTERVLASGVLDATKE